MPDNPKSTATAQKAEMLYREARLSRPLAWSCQDSYLPPATSMNAPEPWDDASQYPALNSVRIFAKGRLICTVDGGTREENIARAARIVACVNFMAGIPSPAETLQEVREAMHEADVALRGLLKVHGPTPAGIFEAAQQQLAAVLAMLPETEGAKK